MSSWVCPLSNDSNCSLSHAIAPDGGLRHISNLNRTELAKQGWLQADFPSRNYYYEHDTTHPSFKQRESIGLTAGSAILEVDVL